MGASCTRRSSASPRPRASPLSFFHTSHLSQQETPHHMPIKPSSPLLPLRRNFEFHHFPCKLSNPQTRAVSLSYRKEVAKLFDRESRRMSCDSIDLRLRLGNASADRDRHSSALRLCGAEQKEERQQQQQQQQITIFYNGQICTRTVTELQARAIICMATSEMDDQMRKESSQPKEKESSLHQRSSVRPPSVEQQLLINPKLSMKRSLQRFLQKRKSRSLAISPYYMRTTKPLFSIKS